MLHPGPLSIVVAGKLPRSQAPLLKHIEKNFPNVRVHAADNEKEAAEFYQQHHSQLTLCDVSTFGITIEKVAALLREVNVDSRIVAVAEPESAPDIVQTIARGARDSISTRDPLHAMLVLAREMEILPDWCARNAQLLEGRIGKEAAAHAVGDDIVWCNDAFLLAMARKAREDLMHHAFWNCIDGDDHYKLKRALQASAAGQPPKSPVEVRALAADGKRIALSLRLSQKQADGGTVVHIAAREISMTGVPAAYGGQINVAVLKRLQAAVSGGGLALALQPITPLADAGGGDVSKLDVLARIKDHDGELAAAEFMREASAAGLLRQIDHWMIRTACAYYARNAAKGEVLLFLRLSRQA
ncbi:MAG TPA: EAL domain-containing protein, partial [Nevskiaceae bacterium]|nr:EAL domain-containing protein [Nevskiaceae bacterium]